MTSRPRALHLELLSFPPARRAVRIKRLRVVLSFHLLNGMYFFFQLLGILTRFQRAQGCDGRLKLNDFVYWVELIGSEFYCGCKVLSSKPPAAPVSDLTHPRRLRDGPADRQRSQRGQREVEMVHHRRVSLRLTCSSWTPAGLHDAVLGAGLGSGLGILTAGSTGCDITWARIMCNLKKSGSAWQLRFTFSFNRPKLLFKTCVRNLLKRNDFNNFCHYIVFAR